MIDLDSSRKLFCYSNLETRISNVWELMESIFGPVPINGVTIEDSLNNGNWPRFSKISDVDISKTPHWSLVSF